MVKITLILVILYRRHGQNYSKDVYEYNSFENRTTLARRENEKSSPFVFTKQCSRRSFSLIISLLLLPTLFLSQNLATVSHDRNKARRDYTIAGPLAWERGHEIEETERGTKSWRIYNAVIVPSNFIPLECGKCIV